MLFARIDNNVRRKICETNRSIPFLDGPTYIQYIPFLDIRVLSLVPLPPSQNPVPFFPIKTE